MTELVITDLYIYPLKSARGIRVDSLSTDRMGPEDDRRWMLVDPRGKFITQRQFPKMALIDVLLSERCIEFSAPHMEAMRLPKSLAGEASNRAECSPVQVWRDVCDALDCGNDAAQWFSDYLQTSCRLVKMPNTTFRYVDDEYASHQETVGFADGFPMLLISEASLTDLNERLSTPVPMLRFRPNVVVGGCGPFEEDHWQQLIAEDASVLKVVKPCARCVIPSIDIDSGEKEAEVLQALKTFRRRDGIIYFGQNALCSEGKTYRVGERLKAVS